MKPGIDWRVWLGMSLTFAWLGLGAIYIHSVIGENNLLTMSPDHLGDFLQGAFAPLAFLWLVIGYFLQKSELASNTAALQKQFDEMQRTAEQAVIQSRVIAASELHARQETLLRIADTVRGQLGAIMGMLYVSSQGATGNGTVSQREQSELFAKLSESNHEVFSQRMLETHFATPADDRVALFYGTPIRARHSNHFVAVFERLMARAEGADPDGLIRSALEDNAHGFVYKLILHYRAIAPKELADIKRTGAFINMGPMFAPTFNVGLGPTSDTTSKIPTSAGQ